LVFLKDVFREKGYSDRQLHRALNRRRRVAQPEKKRDSSAFFPLVGYDIQPNQQSGGTAHQRIDGLTRHKVIQSPLSYQRQPRT
jgi:hypothetical protein